MDFLNFTSTNSFCKVCSDNINNFCDNYNDNIKNKNCLIYKELKKVNFLKNKLEKHNLRNSHKTLIKIILTYLKLTYSINNSSFEIYIEEIDENLLCDDCILNINKCVAYSFDIIYVYIKSYIVTKLFDYISNDNILPILDKLFDDNKFKITVKQKIFEFKGCTFGLCSPKSNNWKGSDYYFKKIYGFPIYFYEYNPKTHNIDKIIDVPLEIYQQRKDIFLEDYICGHPMASHGWYKEALENTEELGIFK